MANHTAIPQTYYAGSWHNHEPDVFTADRITVRRGFAAEGQSQPAQLTWTFNNATDAYRPSNPTSVFWGLGDLNLPAAVASDGTVRGVGEVCNWTPDQSPGFTVGPPLRGKRWVSLVAEGITRRIGQWTDPLRSPMYRQITSYPTLRGYWPMEGPNASTELTNVLPSSPAGYADATTTFEGGDGPPGSEKVLKLSAEGLLRGRFLSMSATAGWQLQFSHRLPAVGTPTPLPLITWRTDNGYTWSYDVTDTTYRILVMSGDIVLKDQGYLFGTGAAPTQWITTRIKVTESAGTVSIEAGWYPAGTGVLYGFTETFSGTPGALQTWEIYGHPSNTDALYGHIFGTGGVTDDLQTYAALRAMDGYVGETAGARFQRLCDEESVSRTVVGTVAQTRPMGRQRADTFVNLLAEIASTEDALIFDARSSLSLTMRTRRDLYNQAPTLALTWPGHVAPPMPEVVDDLGIRNRVTVKQRDGAEATAARLSGRMSVQPPPAGVGEYKGTVDVNVAVQADLPVLAGWWLARGTVPGPRWPTVVVDLDANPGLNAAASAVDIGDRITVTGRAPEPIGLLVIGIYETIETHRRVITFTCVPDQVWLTGIYDSTTRRMDSRTTTLAGSPNTTATSWAITTSNKGEVWSTTSLPYQWIVEGERVTVTAMTAPAGTGPYTQTATVTRSVNGVVKAHAAGEAVHMAPDQLARYGL